MLKLDRMRFTSCYDNVEVFACNGDHLDSLERVNHKSIRNDDDVQKMILVFQMLMVIEEEEMLLQTYDVEALQ